MLGIAQSSVKESEIEPGTKSSKKEGLHLGVGRWQWRGEIMSGIAQWQEIQIWKFLGKRKEGWSGSSTGEWGGHSCTSRPSVRENSYHWGSFLETELFRGSRGSVRARIVREEDKDMEDIVMADWIPESVWRRCFELEQSRDGKRTRGVCSPQGWRDNSEAWVSHRRWQKGSVTLTKCSWFYHRCWLCHLFTPRCTTFMSFSASWFIFSDSKEAIFLLLFP